MPLRNASRACALRRIAAVTHYHIAHSDSLVLRDCLSTEIWFPQPPAPANCSYGSQRSRSVPAQRSQRRAGGVPRVTGGILNCGGCAYSVETEQVPRRFGVLYVGLAAYALLAPVDRKKPNKQESPTVQSAPAPTTKH
jgi:hypothetical protein